MKLHKALKLKKKLVGEIEALRHQIIGKNSYTQGSLDPFTNSVNQYYDDLIAKTEQLISLKITINDANRTIQGKIYRLSELKGIISTLRSTSTQEGIHPAGYGMGTADKVYLAQMSEFQINSLIDKLQEEVDTLQDDIEAYNFNTEI